MSHYPNKIVKNRQSPNNEVEYRNTYKKINKEACKSDILDIAAVITKDGVRGHVLLPQEINRSKDSDYHRGIGFISDEELRQEMKK